MKKIKITKEEYRNALLKDVYAIFFKKKDETYRVMYCTLNEKYIPKTQKEIYRQFLNIQRTEPINALSVFDLQKQKWRRFTIDSIAIFKKIKDFNKLKELTGSF